MTSSVETDFDLSAFLPYMLNMAAEAASAGFQAAYRDRYGMLRTEWRVMFHLARFGETTATEIGRRAKIHKTKISRAVRALEEKRFLVRRASETDRRVETLRLSRAGVEAFHAVAAIASAYDAALWAQFPPEDQAALRRCLAALAARDPDAPRSIPTTDAPASAQGAAEPFAAQPQHYLWDLPFPRGPHP